MAAVSEVDTVTLGFVSVIGIETGRMVTIDSDVVAPDMASPGSGRLTNAAPENVVATVNVAGAVGLRTDAAIDWDSIAVIVDCPIANRTMDTWSTRDWAAICDASGITIVAEFAPMVDPTIDPVVTGTGNATGPATQSVDAKDEDSTRFGVRITTTPRFANDTVSANAGKALGTVYACPAVETVDVAGKGSASEYDTANAVVVASNGIADIDAAETTPASMVVFGSVIDWSVFGSTEPI